MTEIAALRLLMENAFRNPNEPRVSAMFLLSLLHGEEYKANLEEILLYTNYPGIGDAMMELLKYLHRHRVHLRELVSNDEMDLLIDKWDDVLSADT